MLDVYADLCKELLALPVVRGADRVRALLACLPPPPPESTADGRTDGRRAQTEELHQRLHDAEQDAAATAEEVEEKGRKEVAKRERKSTSLWGRAGKAAATAAAGSLSSVVVASVLGKKSSADPIRTGATAFVRNIIGGLMR